MKKYLYILIAVAPVALAGSCREIGSDMHPCYDPSYVYDGPCPEDCPGVTGCDGKFYCNECEASWYGIHIVE